MQLQESVLTKLVYEPINRVLNTHQSQQRKEDTAAVESGREGTCLPRVENSTQMLIAEP